MDKYEYKIRAEEIKTLISRKKYVEAAQVADTIDWSRVKSVMMLCTVSDLYKVNRRFEDARALLEMANERHPAGRMIIYSLCDISIKMGDVVQAIEYYKEFIQIAPNDSSRYTLQYKLYEAQDVGLEERIAVLEEMKKKDYQEKWAYELAYLYHRVGLATKCVEECDELILWFGEGKYVIKAMELKMLHQPLSPAQQQRYEVYMLRKQGLNVPEAMLQEPDPDMEKRMEERAEQPAVRRQNAGEMDIQVKTMDVGKYNTVNLQKELAESMKEVLQNGHAAQSPSLSEYREQIYQEDARVIAGPDTDTMDFPIPGYTSEYVQEQQTEEYYEPAQEYVQEQDREPVQESAQELHQEQSYEQAAAAEPEAVYAHSADDPEKAYDNYLAQEYDGQISLVVPEAPQVERQITGQMNIEDIMKEWDKLKQQNEEKRRQELKQRVMEHTGTLFSDAEKAAVKDILRGQDQEEKDTVDDKTQIFNPVISAQTKVWAAGEVEKAIRRMNEGAEGTAAEATAAAAAAQEAARQEALRQEAIRLKAARLEAEKQEAIRLEAERQAAREQEALLQESMFEDTATLNATIAALAAETAQAESAAAPEAEKTAESTVDLSETQPDAKLAADESRKAALTKEIHKTEETETAETENAEPSNMPEQHSEEEHTEESRRETNRGLSPEEKKLFSSYVPTKSSMKKLISALDTLSLAAYTGNMVVTGDPGADTLDLAKSVVKDIRAKDRNFSGKMAKVTGSDLNGSKKDASALVEQLAGGALVIEEAGDLNRATMQKMLQALNQERWGIVVILTDTRRNVRKLEQENPEMESFFNARFDIEALDNGTLVAYGCQYARTQEYSIDEFGKLALHTRIEDMQTSDHIVTVKDVREIVDDAIYHANRKTPKHFMDILFAKRYDEDDMIILHEGDFI